MKSHIFCLRGRKGQAGAALIVSLMMLIMVSLLAAAGYMLSTTEARNAAGWSDRQRAMFAAEGALKEADSAVAEAIKNAAQDVGAAIKDKPGFYLRTDGKVPDLDPWPTTKNASVKATTQNGSEDNIFYMVVYEGEALSTGNEMLTATGNINKGASKPRFTLYAKAGGIQNGTAVVLSTSKEY